MSKDLLNESSEKLMNIITVAKEKFKNIHEDSWSEKINPGKWSKKEILGHLMDSAVNNHLRFVRAQLAEKEFVTPAYEQDFFVSSQKYQQQKTEELIELWYLYNKHLSVVIKNINPLKLDTACHIGNYSPAPLSFVVTDYVEHMIYHLKQIDNTIEFG